MRWLGVLGSVLALGMGRTPRINRHGGRDHYGELTPLVFAGGGLKMGQVVGQSDGRAERAVTKPYRPPNMLATMMSALVDIGQLRLVPGLPSGILRAITEVEPIQELL